MSKKDEALKLALEALNVATTPLAKDRQEVLRAITALKEALGENQSKSPSDSKVNSAKKPIDYATAIAMGREDFSHSDCPDDCCGCEYFKTCVYPVMD